VSLKGAGEDAIANALQPGPDDPQPLSEEEVGLKERLLEEGFSNWNKRCVVVAWLCRPVRGRDVRGHS
jgi:hypothetical protein